MSRIIFIGLLLGSIGAASTLKAQVYIYLTMDQPPKLELEMGADESICKGDSVVLMPVHSGGKGPYSYSWQPQDGLSNASVQNPSASPDSTTIYKLTITDSNACSVVDSQWVLVEICGGLETVNKDHWKLLPNPGHGYFKLISGQGLLYADFHLELKDGQGRLVPVQWTNEGDGSIALKTWSPPGTYLLGLRSGSLRFYLPLIIQ